MLPTRWLASLLCASLLSLIPIAAAQFKSEAQASDRTLRHQTPEWQNLAPHLPDPETATPDALQLAADVMRARRMPEDALEYYEAALKRGGDTAVLANRIGVTELELHHATLARAAFHLALRSSPKSGQTWNNLGAAEYMSGNYRAAISDYLKAVKLDKKSAVFHSNLGTAYFDVKDYESGRQQLAQAIKLDPNVFQGGGWTGIEAHVVSAEDRGRFCFEMARLAAGQGDDKAVVRWLAKASESGFETRAEMDKTRDFDAYRKDPRVALVIRNAHALRGGQLAESEVESLPARP